MQVVGCTQLPLLLLLFWSAWIFSAGWRLVPNPPTAAAAEVVVQHRQRQHHRQRIRQQHTGISRRTALQVGSLSQAALLVPEPKAAAAAVAAPLPPGSYTLVPMSLCGGAYCITYTLDDQPFRAVIDTGSAFLLVDGTCEPWVKRGATVWGCYQGDGRPSLLPDTFERFGGYNADVQWRRGTLSILPAVVAEKGGHGAGPPLRVDDIIFGAVRSYVGKGGGGAVFLGLVKERNPRIRPTLLEQTDVASVSFDFIGRTMKFSNAPQISRSTDALPLIDLRPRGVPVAVYACRIQQLMVNGIPIRLDRPTVAIIDTGTTGLTVSDTLFDSGLIPLPVREAQIELLTERGRSCTLKASVRRRPNGEIVDPRLGPDAEEYDEFPLVVSSESLPWFEPGFIYGQECADGLPFACDGKSMKERRSLLSVLATRLADGLGAEPHVLFVGLAFLWKRQLTIDIDAKRMEII